MRVPKNGHDLKNLPKLDTSLPPPLQKTFCHAQGLIQRRVFVVNPPPLFRIFFKLLGFLKIKIKTPLNFPVHTKKFPLNKRLPLVLALPPLR